MGKDKKKKKDKRSRDEPVHSSVPKQGMKSSEWLQSKPRRLDRPQSVDQLVEKKRTPLHQFELLISGDAMRSAADLQKMIYAENEAEI